MTIGTGFARLADGGRLHFEVTGAGKPILLLRPLGGSMSLWGSFAAELAARCEVIAFDPRGVGESSDPPWGLSTRAMAGDALELLDFLGVARAHVFGLSLGGMVATWLALDAPERIERLALGSTLAEATDLKWQCACRTLRLARNLARPGVEAEVAMVRAVLSARFVREQPERVREIERVVRAVPTRRSNLLVLALAAARHDAAHELRLLGVPTLWLFGGEDPIAGVSALPSWLRSAAVPSRIRTIPGAGHDLSLEVPETLANHVLEFCALEFLANQGTPEFPSICLTGVK